MPYCQYQVLCRNKKRALARFYNMYIRAPKVRPYDFCLTYIISTISPLLVYGYQP